jgi:hypothetical protein
MKEMKEMKDNKDMEDNKDRKLIKTMGIEAVTMGDDLALLNEETGRYIVLNDIGTEIWNLVDGKRSETEIVSQLLRDYAVDASTCEVEVHHFVEGLVTQGLVQRS